MDEAEVFKGEKLWCGRWIDVEVWKWKSAGLLPAFNLRLDLGSPQQVCFLGRRGTFFLDGHVHVRTPAVVLGAVSAMKYLVSRPQQSAGNNRDSSPAYIPLREVLVTTNVSTLTGLTTFA